MDSPITVAKSKMSNVMRFCHIILPLQISVPLRPSLPISTEQMGFKNIFQFQKLSHVVYYTSQSIGRECDETLYRPICTFYQSAGQAKCYRTSFNALYFADISSLVRPSMVEVAFNKYLNFQWGIKHIDIISSFRYIQAYCKTLSFFINYIMNRHIQSLSECIRTR